MAAIQQTLAELNQSWGSMLVGRAASDLRCMSDGVPKGVSESLERIMQVRTLTGIRV